MLPRCIYICIYNKFTETSDMSSLRLPDVQLWRHLPKQQIRLGRLAVAKPLDIPARPAEAIRDARPLPLIQVLQNVQLGTPGHPVRGQVASACETLVLRIYVRRIAGAGAQPLLMPVDGGEHGGRGSGDTLGADGLPGVQAARAGPVRRIVRGAFFGHDQAVVDDLGVLLLPFLEAAAANRVLAVVRGRLLLIAAFVEVFLVVLFDLGYICVDLLAVWPLSAFHPFPHLMQCMTYKYVT